MSAKISFLIPTYNRANYVGRCIDSILATRRTDIEILVSNNCSTDNTRSVLSGFKDPRLVIFHNDSNVGEIRNMLSLLKNATGEYCFILTDDDYLLPDAVNILVSYLENNDVSFCTSDAIIFMEKSRIAYNNSFIAKSGAFTPLESMSQFKVLASAGVISRVCIKRSMLNLLDLDTLIECYFPQIAIGLAIWRHGCPIGYIAEPLVCHTWENEIYWSSTSAIIEGSITSVIRNVSKSLPLKDYFWFTFRFSLVFPSLPKGWYKEARPFLTLLVLVTSTVYRKLRSILWRSVVFHFKLNQK